MREIQLPQTGLLDWTGVLGELRREYLSAPLGTSIRFLPSLKARRNVRPHFFRLVQTGAHSSAAAFDALQAMQNALTACHAPGQYTLVFLAANSGQTTAIYLGIQAHPGYSLQRSFLASIIHFLESNWVGTRFVEVTNQEAVGAGEKTQFDATLEVAFDDPQSILAVTGVPSLRKHDQTARAQALDRLLNGMRDAPFLYMVVAEPIGSAAVDELVASCQDLAGRAHLAVRASLTRSDSQQASLSFTQTEGTSLADQVGESHSSSTGTSTSLFTVLSANSSSTNGSSRSITTTDSTSEAVTAGVVTGVGSSRSHEFVDLKAQAVETQLLRYVDRMTQARSSGCWEVGAYFISSDAGVASRAALQLRALLAGDLSFHESFRIHDLTGALSDDLLSSLRRFEIPEFSLIRGVGLDSHESPTLADRRQHLLGSSFSGLSTPVNTEELSLLVNLPQREVPGIPCVATAAFRVTAPAVAADGSIDLGCLIDTGRRTAARYRIPMQGLAKHTLVTGINGSGKSTTIRRVLRELRSAPDPIPFLVIEPAKEEYVAWATEHNGGLDPDDPGRISIFCPGAHAQHSSTEFHRLVLNPLEVVWLSDKERPNVLGHIDLLRSILVSAFPSEDGDVLPVVLEELLYYVYESAGTNWLGDEMPDPGAAFPNLSTMADNAAKVIDRSYEMRIQKNIFGAITTRLKNLRQGWKRELFGSQGEPSTPWAMLFDRPAVINLSNLEDDSDKCLAMSLILMFLYEYRRNVRRAQPNGLAPSRLRHVTVVEEAHRVMLKGEPGVRRSGRQSRVAEMFSNVLSEIRAYGEGFVIADQVPSRLIPDAIKNTNLKIVHRLVANDDREAMAGSMTMDRDQMGMINRLRPGQAIVFGDMDDAPSWLEIAR